MMLKSKLWPNPKQLALRQHQCLRKIETIAQQMEQAVYHVLYKCAQN